MTVNRNRHLIPEDWPNREFSQFIDAGSLSWHVQLHKMASQAGAQSAISPKDAKEPKEPLTLVLLHGTGASAHSWAGLIPTLQQFAHVVNLDLPGHGFTAGAAISSLTLPAMAKEIDALFLALKLHGKIVMVGHSAGAPLAIEWALQPRTQPLPFTLAHIIGLNPSLVPPPTLYTSLLGPMVAPIATSSSVTSLISSLAASTGLVNQLLDSTQSQVPAHQRKYYQYLFSQAAHVRGAMGFMAGADLPALLQRSSALTVPVTFLLGATDSWVKEVPLKAVIAQSFPKAHVVSWPGGHLLHEEQPQEVAKFIQTALAR
jgi:magnesium chelatase accessory protein